MWGSARGTTESPRPRTRKVHSTLSLCASREDHVPVSLSVTRVERFGPNRRRNLWSEVFRVIWSGVFRVGHLRPSRRRNLSRTHDYSQANAWQDGPAPRATRLLESGSGFRASPPAAIPENQHIISVHDRIRIFQAQHWNSLAQHRRVGLIESRRVDASRRRCKSKWEFISRKVLIKWFR